MLAREHPPLIFRDFTELKVGVLQSQVRKLDFVDYFFSLLSADRHPDNPRFWDDFAFTVKVLRAEALLVLQDYDKLAPNPFCDLVIWFAYSIECKWIAAVE